MSEFVRSNSGILVPKQPKRKPTVTIVPCGYCPKIIMCEAEPNKHPHVHKGKPMCRVCCVMKKGKLAPQIRSQQAEAEADQLAAVESQRAAEAERVAGVSAESNVLTLKNLTE